MKLTKCHTPLDWRWHVALGSRHHFDLWYVRRRTHADIYGVRWMRPHFDVHFWRVAFGYSYGLGWSPV